MVESISATEEQECVFRIHTSAASSEVWSFVLGFVLIAAGIVGALFAMFVSPKGPVFLQLSSTLPILLGIGCLLSAWATRRTPLEVAIGTAGVRVTYRHGSQICEWNQIGCAITKDVAMGRGRCLYLYDLTGRCVLKISAAISDFDALRTLIEGRIAATHPDDSERLRLAKSRRNAMLGVALGIFMAIASGSIAWSTHEELRADRLLRESSILGDAEVEDHFLAPNGITPRLVYRITTPDGRTATRNTEVERSLWDQLDQMKTVPVIYVADEPSISRLAQGEVDPRSQRPRPVAGYGIAILGACMSVLSFLAAGMLWRGLDLGTDPVTGRFGIRRFGVTR